MTTADVADVPVASPRPRPAAARRRTLLCVGVLLIAGTLAYAAALESAFVLDDRVHIIESTRIQSVFPLGETLAHFDRSLVRLSLAVSYATSEALTGDGLDPRAYNLFNLGIHLLAGLTLFGLIRRAIARAAPWALWRQRAHWLALAVALLWLVHPLTTQAVTYTIQRAESMASLFYLLALYALLRSDAPAPDAPRARWGGLGWLALAGGACVLGALTKPIIVTAPLVMLLLDRAVLTGSLGETLRRRGWFYAVFVIAGLGLSAYLLAGTVGRETTAGLGVETITPLAYLAHQPAIVLHYLSLALWPVGLTFDYAWPQAETLATLAPTWLVMGVLVVLTLWTLWRHPLIGTPAAAFLLILAPTSSVVPFDDLAVEHRMYLPLAALAALLVPAGWWALQRGLHRAATPAGATLLVALAIGLGASTAARNVDYRSAERLWRDTVAKAPHNHRAHHNLAAALYRTGDYEAANQWYHSALRLDPGEDVADARVGLARSYVQLGQWDTGARHYAHVLEHMDEPYAPALHGLGALRGRQGRLDEAQDLLRRAVEADPDLAEAHADLANVLEQRGDGPGAIAALTRAIELRDDRAPWHNALGRLRAMAGDLHGALRSFERAVELNPADPDARANLEQARRMLEEPSW